LINEDALVISPNYYRCFGGHHNRVCDYVCVVRERINNLLTSSI